MLLADYPHSPEAIFLPLLSFSSAPRHSMYFSILSFVTTRFRNFWPLKFRISSERLENIYSKLIFSAGSLFLFNRQNFDELNDRESIEIKIK